MAHSRRSRPHDFESSNGLIPMEKQILKYLHDHYRSENAKHETLEIVHGVGKKTKTDINKFLYSLQKKGYILKIVESPPAWKLLNFVPNMHAPHLAAQWPGPSSCSDSIYVSPDTPSTFIPPDTPSTFIPTNIPNTSTPSDAFNLETATSVTTVPHVPFESSSLQGESTIGSRIEPIGQSVSVNDFVIPPTPADLLKDATSSFYNVSIRENKPFSDVENEVLEILNKIKGKLETEYILARVAGYGSDAVRQALRDLKDKNLILKDGNYYFIVKTTTVKLENTIPKSHFATENELNSFEGKAFVRHDSGDIQTNIPPPSTSFNHSLAPPPVMRLPDGKNAISVLNEYAQGKQWKINYIERMNGPDHMRRFTMTIELGGQRYQGQQAATKKDAKLKAAESALTILYNAGGIESSMATDALVYSASEQREASLHDRVASLVIQKYNMLSQQLPDTITGKKIIAGFVMTRKLKSGETTIEVVSIGSGNRCVKGDKLSLRGETVNDCHAEIIARRGLIRYLYRKLLDRDDSKFVLEADKYVLTPEVQFHLYISTAPCGDSAIFAPSDIATDQPRQDGEDGIHHPLFENKKQGLLRTKVESGEGCIPVEEDTAAPTWDGILRGERLRTMSCSDKIAKWNFLGLQGSLLSHFLRPIYLSTLTLGMLYNHGHLTRAVCCRVQKLTDTLEKGLEPPTAYTVNHPNVGTCSQNQNRETGKLKTREYSVNWSLGDERPEVLDGTEGKCESRFGSVNPPRLCKAEIYKEFKKLCTKMDQDDLYKESYFKSKMAATEYQNAKNTLRYAFEKNGYGKWMPKPKEEKDF